jgi:hypothetical protein
LDDSYVGGKGIQPQTASTGSFGVYFSVQLPTDETVNLQLNRSTHISLSPTTATVITMKRTNPSYPFNHAIRPCRRRRHNPLHGITLQHQFEEMFGAPEDTEHFDVWLADQPQLADDDAPAPGGGADQPPAPVGQRLANLRANFNPTNILRASKAASTFAKHKSNHERFIVHLYLTTPQLLHQEICQQMNDVVANINYSSVISKYDKYHKNGGKKSLEERKKEYKIRLLRGKVKDALGAPSTTPPQPTVKFELLTEDVTLFLGYIAEMRRDNGGLLKPGAYASFRSSLQYLFFRYKYDVTFRYEKELKNALEGVKRYTNTAVQAGEGSIFDGDAALPWALYEQFNRWFLAKGDKDGIFAACFSKLTCNLACQGSSTSQI